MDGDTGRSKPVAPAARRSTGPGGALDGVLEWPADHADSSSLGVFSTVAHELRGPLMALATSAELLAADCEHLPAAQLRDLVAGIHCRALWLQGLVENLLCAAALGQGRLRLHCQPLVLPEVVAEVHQIVLPLLQQRAQRLRIRVRRGPRVGRRRSELPEVPADGRRLGQVLVNLILNASKFGPAGTVVDVTLALARRGTAVRVTVADRGQGLPPGAAARLFEPFYRAPTVEQGGPAGVGLGLAIVKSIVERHGGRLGAANRRGGGARFWFDLPLPPAAMAEPAPGPRGRAIQRQNPGNVSTPPPSGAEPLVTFR
ncbi:MAG: sensor histidine kinase [Chloroflexota bacterium]